jgi:signal peptidase II
MSTGFIDGSSILLRGLTAALVAFLTDQFSKFYIGSLFDGDPTTRVVNARFNLVHAFNTGVSFSMFDNGGRIGQIVLILFALAVVAFLGCWLRREKDPWTALALGLIIGGALGNVADRLYFGAVRDFLDFHYEGWHWPAFNGADTFICLGAFLICVREIYQHHYSQEKTQ